MDSDTDSPEEQYMALSSVIASLSEEKQQAEARLKKLSDLGGSVYRVNHSKATSLEGELATPATRYHKLTSGWLGGRFKRPKKWWNRREIRKLDRDIEERTHALDSERYSVEYAQRGIQRISQELGISPDVSKGGVKSLEHETIGQIRTLDDRIQSAKVKKMGLSAQVYNLSEAHTVFGDRLYGPQHFYDVFGYDINPQDMPKLPTRTVMEKTRDLGAVLALRVYDTPLDRGKQRKSEWVMFLPRLHPDTVDRDYFE
ncbi:MAG: hypothetical protein QGH34_02270, partial [Candidatus Woesearchaeota archaeon]|nr:hypothetical protein [Candidatus Woesearchaeota archaeon]